MTRIERSTVIEAPVEKVFAFVIDFENFLRASSPEMETEILSQDEGPRKIGYKVRVRSKVGGKVWDVEVEITEFVENERYVTRQTGGPMKKFDMIDTFEPTNGGTRWTAILDYELPYSLLGKLMDRLKVRKAFEESSNYYTEKTKELIEKG